MTLAPGAVIGIVGGGQLGRMTALAAARLGYRCHILTPEADAPAVQVTNRATIAPYDDPEALEAFAAAVDVVTIEFENLPLAPLERLARSRPVRPAPSVLAICQDRIREKGFLQSLDVAVAPWRAVRDGQELSDARAAIEGPALLKTARLGYDGKGQRRLAAGEAAGPGWRALGEAPAVLEAEVAFEREISVITARTAAGHAVSFVPVENRHRDGILVQTLAPAPIPVAVAEAAVALAERVAHALDLVGLLAVEMFMAEGGRLLVNELAPRPHNSGHWTIDACATSQFEQLVRAICDLPLGDPGRLADATMDNLIGEGVNGWPALCAEPGARLHLYGKREVRAGRKLGHVTRLRPLS